MTKFEIYNQFSEQGQEFKTTSDVYVYGERLELKEDGTTLIYDSDDKLVGIVPKGLTVVGRLA